MNNNCGGGGVVVGVIMLLLVVVVLVVAQGSESSNNNNTALLGGKLMLRRRRRMDVTEDKGIPTTTTPLISPSPGPISVTRSDLSNSANLPPAAAANKQPFPQEDEDDPSPLTPKSNSPKLDPQQQQQEGTNDNCDAAASFNKCTDQTMLACLQHPKQKQFGVQEFILLVQNEGESSLKVSINVPDSVKVDLTELQIPKHQTKKINVSVNARESPKIILNAGYGNCVLQAGVPISQANFFHQIPSYTTLLTPVYGAYFLFLIALIVGGIWACCMFGKRGRPQGSGIPYQELEMGLPGSGSAVNVETADGWDESWDDDWDEDRAVKSPSGGQHIGNVSANGLTARSSNRDGWGNDWDD